MPTGAGPYTHPVWGFSEHQEVCQLQDLKQSRRSGATYFMPPCLERPRVGSAHSAQMSFSGSLRDPSLEGNEWGLRGKYLDPRTQEMCPRRSSPSLSEPSASQLPCSPKGFGNATPGGEEMKGDAVCEILGVWVRDGIPAGLGLQRGTQEMHFIQGVSGGCLRSEQWTPSLQKALNSFVHVPGTAASTP